MSTPEISTTQAIRTLPDGLAHHARWRPATVALRQKRLGLWQPRSWADLATEVAALSGALLARGFRNGATLVLISHPRAEALLVSLAVQQLGGTVVVIDPTQGEAQIARLIRHIGAQYAFAEDQQQVDRLYAALPEPHALQSLIYADPRGLSHYQQTFLEPYAGLLAGERIHDDNQAQAAREAFVFLDIDESDAIVELAVTHRELLEAGQQLIDAERLDASEVAFASRGFTASGHARYLVAPWLIAGFSLNFPENLGTRDNDRRELGPTLVAGTRETYARLAGWVSDRLPAPGTWLRRVVDRVLAPADGQTPGFFGWLVRKALRDVIGFSRIKAPLLVGPSPDAHTRTFFSQLGIDVRHWPESKAWRPALASTLSSAPEAHPQGLRVVAGLTVNLDLKAT